MPDTMDAVQPQEQILVKPATDKKNSVGSTVLAILFAVFGIAAVAAVLFSCIRYADQPPMLLAVPEEADRTVTSMLDAVCEGNYSEACQYILGTPDLGADRQSADELGMLFWNAIQDSMEYELVGECYVTEAGLAQDITFTFLDLESLTAKLRDRSQTMLEQRVQEALDPSEIYDEENNYREDVVLDVLYEAAVLAIDEDGKNTTIELTVNLQYQDGRWWIVADKALLDAISGGILF